MITSLISRTTRQKIDNVVVAIMFLVVNNIVLSIITRNCELIWTQTIFFNVNDNQKRCCPNNVASCIFNILLQWHKFVKTVES